MSAILAILGMTFIGVGVLWRLNLPKERMPQDVERGRLQPDAEETRRLDEVVAGLGRETRPAASAKARTRGTDTERSGGEGQRSRAGLFGNGEASSVDSALAGGDSLIAQKQRRSQRILLRVPVQVEGTDTQGDIFTEKTYTLHVNRYGCSLNLRNPLRTDDLIKITNTLTRQTCTFRVREAAQVRQGEVTEWGAECLEPERNFWGISFPEEEVKPLTPSSVPVEMECLQCHSREMATLSPEEFLGMAGRSGLTRACEKCGSETQWQFAFVEEEVESPRVPSPEPEPSGAPAPQGIEKRRHERLALKILVRIRCEDGREENPTTEDISESGICCAAALDMKVTDPVLLTIDPGGRGGDEESPARVVWRRAGSEPGKALYGIMLEGTNEALASLIDDFGG